VPRRIPGRRLAADIPCRGNTDRFHIQPFRNNSFSMGTVSAWVFAGLFSTLNWMQARHVPATAPQAD
ncbi:MAG: hypothetical protein VW446_12565, partial [Alphaproteobacteria bacterium]